MTVKNDRNKSAQRAATAARRYRASLSSGRSLFELVEDGAPRHHTATWRVWVWALQAIHDGKLPYLSLDGRGLFLPSQREPIPLASLDALICHGGRQIAWRPVIAGDLREVMESQQVPRYFGRRYKSVAIDAAVFWNWLDATAAVMLPGREREQGTGSSLVSRKRHPQLDAAHRALGALYRQEPLASVKVITGKVNKWLVENDGISVSEDTVSRALITFKPRQARS